MDDQISDSEIDIDMNEAAKSESDVEESSIV